ncbi:unnamed protein product [Sphagnum jensenii]|uniref:SANT domain-containing protein n=1 Tax=Sphagnum jensenii TaxID=128206 RepID=A0ABP0WK46_9BRYO
MASARRPRTFSRPAATKGAEGGGVTTDREDDGGGDRYKQRKRKLADMLGPPWSEDELNLFYQGYRKYGKDWKKVAANMHKRTVEMVEALYNTNKAYLSLPEGAASVAGLIAMMTDHYNLLDDSQSQNEDTSDEHEISDEPPYPTQPWRGRTGAGNVGLETSSMQSNGPVGTSVFSGSSPARKPRTNRSRAVGKRTSRFPVQSTVQMKMRHHVSPTNFSLQDEEELESHVAAAHTLVSRRTASPSVSNTPSRRSLRQVMAQQNGDSKETLLRTESDTLVKPATTMTAKADIGSDGSEESKEYDGATRASSSTRADKRVGQDGKNPAACEVRSRLKRPTSKLVELHNVDDKYQDAKDSCVNTDAENELEEEEEGHRHGSGADLVQVSKQEALGQWQQHPLQAPERPKKRSRQLFSGDSNSGLDALATLAASSLMSLLGPDAAAAVEDNRGDADMAPENETSPNQRDAMDKTKGEQSNVKIELENVNLGGEGWEGDEKKDMGAVVVVDRQPLTSPESQKRKRKTTIAKVIEHDPVSSEEGDEVSLKPHSKLKSAAGAKTVSSRPVLKPLIHGSETAAEGGSRQKEAIMEAGEDQAIEIDESLLPLKLRSKKKAVPEKFIAERVGSARVTHCLCTKVRQWCMCEWFYSAIDLPWFARNEFVEYLNHAGLGHVPRLARVEWGVIRSSLGKPRRLSKRFLEEEREKLARYRESVRIHHHELRIGLRECLPADLAHPLTVGQKVIARHPKTREMHDGSILTVDRCRCRVQFDDPDLGVELVLDIDAMPIHQLENMPEVMRRCRVLVDGGHYPLLQDAKDHKLRVALSAGVAARAALNEQLEWPACNVIPFSQIFLNDLSKRAQVDSADSIRSAKASTNEAAAAAQKVGLSQPFGISQLQARDADVRALADLSRALDKKEALVAELRQMNDEANVNCNGLRISEAFQRQYATVVLQLKEANKQVATALVQLRQRNKYQENVVPPWHRYSPQGVYVLGSSDSANTGELGPLYSGPGLAEMADSAKEHARLMVTTAVKAMDAVKDGEDAFQKLGCALEALPKLGGSFAALQTPSPCVDPVAKATHLDQAGFSSVNAEGASLLELMTSCVATLFMLQTLSDGTYSQSDVNQTLDTAFLSLLPKSAQNHCIYKEIEQQLGIVKAQITGHIPVRSTMPFGVDMSIPQTHTA